MDGGSLSRDTNVATDDADIFLGRNGLILSSSVCRGGGGRGLPFCRIRWRPSIIAMDGSVDGGAAAVRRGGRGVVIPAGGGGRGVFGPGVMDATKEEDWPDRRIDGVAVVVPVD